ncbi:nucleotide exchange factor GrpE [Orrella daihaiensis]|uniref:Protein GrpE n=1 Tax=Orrella daihaiensis TaxID=2782176 RepID=A0ABY4AM18_9BURK|nr:nucleotide exchange factor GrpE [Orrella daihaiensis]UOD51361.1 nucleotide exchange factor GrpE [Orrella daihaiensis]
MTEKTDAERPEEQTPQQVNQDSAQAQGQAQDQTPEQEQTSGEPADPVQALQAALADAEARVQEHYDNLLRAQAEMENVRRRAQEEVVKARKFGIESFAEGLVPVKDSLEAALAQAGQSADDMRAGIETTLKQLASAFERNHLKEIAPAAGDKFDPHHHQAIATVPAEQDANTVVAVLQKGYLIADRVLRPALVTVAS